MLALDSFRDPFPTSPYDLSEYAREHTGPASWSAHPDAEALSSWALAEHGEPYCVQTTNLLSCIGPLDVPSLAVPRGDVAEVVGHREAFVLASIDGRSTCEMLLDVIDLPPGELLTILCNLCARGFVSLRPDDAR